MGTADSAKTQISPLAGHRAPAATLVDIDSLIMAYHSDIPDPRITGQRVAFGTSGHRGSSLSSSFNESHVVAIARVIPIRRTWPISLRMI